MQPTIVRVGLAGACCVACGNGPDERSTPAATEADPLVGTWRWRGKTPGPTALSVTFNADGTFALVAQIRPASLPAGSSPLPPPGFDADSCVPVLFCNGTYEEAVSQGAPQLNWSFTDGTKGTISGCDDPSENSPGAPLTDDEVSSFIYQGHLPPRTLTYDVSTSDLHLASFITTSPGGTTFTRAP